MVKMVLSLFSVDMSGTGTDLNSPRYRPVKIVRHFNSAGRLASSTSSTTEVKSEPVECHLLELKPVECTVMDVEQSRRKTGELLQMKQEANAVEKYDDSALEAEVPGPANTSNLIDELFKEFLSIKMETIEAEYEEKLKKEKEEKERREKERQLRLQAKDNHECTNDVSNADGRWLESKEVGNADGRQRESKEVGNADGGQLESKEVGNADGRQLESKEVGNADGRWIESKEVGNADRRRPESKEVSNADGRWPESKEVGSADRRRLERKEVGNADGRQLKSKEVGNADGRWLDSKEKSHKSKHKDRSHHKSSKHKSERRSRHGSHWRDSDRDTHSSHWRDSDRDTHSSQEQREEGTNNRVSDTDRRSSQTDSPGALQIDIASDNNTNGLTTTGNSDGNTNTQTIKTDLQTQAESSDTASQNELESSACQVSNKHCIPIVRVVAVKSNKPSTEKDGNDHRGKVVEVSTHLQQDATVRAEKDDSLWDIALSSKGQDAKSDKEPSASQSVFDNANVTVKPQGGFKFGIKISEKSTELISSQNKEEGRYSSLGTVTEVQMLFCEYMADSTICLGSSSRQPDPS